LCQQANPRRFHGFLEGLLSLLPGHGIGHRLQLFDSRIYGRMIRIEFGRHNLEKTFSPLTFQAQIRVTQSGRPAAGRNLAAPALQAGAHVVQQLIVVAIA
jgi:hypothetical protein